MGAKSTAAALVSVVIVGAVGWSVVFRMVRERLHASQPAADPSAVQAQREERTMPVVEPAPAPVPTAIPLAGGDGTLPDGYPIAHVDAWVAATPESFAPYLRPAIAPAARLRA